MKMGQKNSTIKLPELFRRTRRTFWKVYLGTLVGIPALTFLMVLSIMGWEGMKEDFGMIRLRDGLMIFLILFVYSSFLLLFYLGLRASQKQCLEQYEAMSAVEKREMDYYLRRGIAVGQVVCTEGYFLHRDKYRLFFYYIHSYEEIVWAYQAQSLYQADQMEFLPVPVMASSDLRFHTIVLWTRDRRKYAIFMGDWDRFTSYLPERTVLGYGKEQKKQAKERQWQWEEYDQSIPGKRWRRRWKFAGLVAGVILILGTSVGAIAYLDSNWYEYRRMWNKARTAAEAGEYSDAVYYYTWALSICPNPKSAERIKEEKQAYMEGESLWIN